MYLSTSDGVDGVDVDAQSQPPKATTPPMTTTTTSSPPSSPCCSTLLVIDDNSNSNDSTVINADIPTKPPTPNVQTSPVQKPSPSPPLPTADANNDTPAQQRRRNSSIAKLLGGQPLNNQQYEDITQQILVDQSTQNAPNTGEKKSDGEIPRSRSSITRKMLKDAEENKNASTKARPPSPGFSKDFEYLIRRELDIEHAPSTLQRDGSKPSVFQGLRSIRNSPSQSPKPQSPTPPKLKRKRSLPKPTTPLPAGAIRSSNGAPFSIRDPFELDSSAPSLVPPARHSHAPHQNGLFHFDFAQHHSRHQNLPPPTTLPHPQQFSSPVNTSSSFNYQKPSSSLYARFKVDPSSFSAPYNYTRFPRTADLGLAAAMSPASVHTSSSPVTSHPSAAATTRKIKTIPNRPDMFEFAMHRTMSNTSHQSTGSTSSSSSSPGPSDYCAPLKKRLLQSYKNEQRPASSS